MPAIGEVPRIKDAINYARTLRDRTSGAFAY